MFLQSFDSVSCLLLPPPLGWIQGLDYSAADASAIEDRNALALAIVTSDPGNILSLCCFPILLLQQSCMAFCLPIRCYPHIAGAAPTFNSNAVQKDFDATGWELALVTTPSSNISSVNERQLVGLVVLPPLRSTHTHTYFIGHLNTKCWSNGFSHWLISCHKSLDMHIHEMTLMTKICPLFI